MEVTLVRKDDRGLSRRVMSNAKWSAKHAVIVSLDAGRSSPDIILHPILPSFRTFSPNPKTVWMNLRLFIEPPVSP